MPYNKRLGVYLKNLHDDKISSFFITELIEMKNKLMVYIEIDEEIYAKAKYSKMAVEKL